MAHVIEKYGEELLPYIKVGMGMEIAIGIISAIIFIVVFFKFFD